VYRSYIDWHELGPPPWGSSSALMRATLGRVTHNLLYGNGDAGFVPHAVRPSINQNP
jgi:hypothetical protein